MILMYALALIMIFVLTFHLLLVSPLTGRSFDQTLTYSYVVNNLTYYRVVFGILLYAAVIHGMNGLRIIVLEWIHPKRAQWAVNLIIIALIAILLAVGTYTLIVV